jgi:hypothetical protein
MPHRPTRFLSHGESALAAFLILAWTQFAHAFDPATDHTCVYNCGGGGGGGGFVARRRRAGRVRRKLPHNRGALPRWQPTKPASRRSKETTAEPPCDTSSRQCD